MFLIIIFAIFLGDVGWWLWADRKLRGVPRAKLWRTIVGVWGGFMVGYLLFFIIFNSLARHAHAFLPVWAMAVVYVWHLLILPATILVMGGEQIAALAAWVARSRRPKSNPPHIEPSSDGISRRQLLATAVAMTPPLATFAATGIALQRVQRFRVRSIELALPQLPADLDGMTIAHVTDLHVGRFTRPSALPRIADAVNQLRADLVLFTGDLIDLTLADLPAGLDFLRKLDPRSGLFLCEGNHDLIEDPDGFEFGVRRAGVPLLLNESTIATVRNTQLQIMGLTWRRGDFGIAGDMSRLITERRPDLFQILLAHHPHAFDPAAAMGIPLTLSGHTHGGQLMLNERLGVGPIMFRYWSGAYRKNDSALVVSNGVGNWFPLRINAPAEIVHLTLRQAV
jgi:uncharacterized protein